MAVDWENVTELAIAAAVGGVIAWMASNSAAPFFKRHRIRIFRLPIAPIRSTDSKWYGYFIRNVGRSSTNNIEIYINQKIESVTFDPPISNTKKDIDENTTAILINTFPAKSEYEFWVKADWYPSITATADGQTIEEDLATRILGQWRGWHIALVYAVIFIIGSIIFGAIGAAIPSNDEQVQLEQTQ